MSVTKGSSLIGLLAGLLDGEGTADLATALQDVLKFAQDDHCWQVNIHVRHNPLDDPRD